MLRATKRILYVDDNEDSCEMITVLLEIGGYEVATAHTVDDGLSRAKLEQFDLYVMDNRFPDGTGVDLCRLIRASDEDTPIIFYSGAAYPYDIKEGLDAGAQCYLTKPSGIYDIERTITGLLAGTGEVMANPRQSQP
ncbi:MAG TPA: response regulator [Blastocatellia bacterium]|nr:response regulator [Blastocatellia bacterium]